MKETSATYDRTQAQPEERESSETSIGTTCPECSGDVLYDSEHGECTCRDCGLVVDDDVVDRGPEWRGFNESERDERRRVGSPITARMHDRGLSTTIGWRNADASGSRLSSRQRAKLQRLRAWDERFRTKTAQERSLKGALSEIERMGSALGLPNSCREIASVLSRRAVDEDLLRGRSIEALASATLYAAAREHGTPRTLDAMAGVSRVEKLAIQRTYRQLSRELGLGIEPADPVQYLHEIVSQLQVSDEAERRARELLDRSKPEGVHSGKSPKGLAAAAIYAAARLTDESLTQRTVSEVADVSPVTIRDRYQELLAVSTEQGAG